MGSDFFKYSAFSNNCQDFVIALLQSNGLLTPELREFILQPVEALIQAQPGYTSDVAQTLTNLGGIVGRVVEGYGTVPKSLAPACPHQKSMDK
jgi:hypothetical protein